MEIRSDRTVSSLVSLEYIFPYMGLAILRLDLIMERVSLNKRLKIKDAIGLSNNQTEPKMMWRMLFDKQFAVKCEPLKLHCCLYLLHQMQQQSLGISSFFARS